MASFKDALICDPNALSNRLHQFYKADDVVLNATHQEQVGSEVEKEEDDLTNIDEAELTEREVWKPFPGWKLDRWVCSSKIDYGQD